MLTRDALLAAKDLCPKETVSIPELGGDVIMQGLTAKELASFRQSIGKADQETAAYKMLAMSIKDDKGARLLVEDDWKIIQDWPSRLVQRLVDVANRLNGFGRSPEGPLPETSSEDLSSD
jgi:hypothetical protein